MLESTRCTLLEVLECLGTLVQDEVVPEQACERLDELRARHPQANIELVWEEQQFDHSLHYDALIRGPEAMTVSLSVCPDRALPWPLRGVQKSRDSDLLRVNGTVLSVADGAARLDVLWQSDALMQSLIDACLIDGAIRTQAIEIGPQDLQKALDAIRRRRGLYTAEATRAWMQASGATEQTLEHLATGVALAAKLRDLIAAERAGDKLRDHARDYDLIDFAALRMPSEEAARAAADAVRDGRDDFHGIVERAFLQGRGAGKAPYFRRLRRYRLEAALQCALDGAEAGEVVGPVVLRDGTYLIKLLAVTAAQVDEEPTIEAAKTRVFEEWLAERRRTAKIEWFWGTKHRTSRREEVQSNLAWCELGC
jgi:putative peptide maturation system protein